MVVQDASTMMVEAGEKGPQVEQGLFFLDAGNEDVIEKDER
jgi:hypothetical protein